VALIKETDLVDQWQFSRPPLLRIKDSALGLFSGRPDDADAIDTMVSTLQTHLDIGSKEGTVTIGLDWPDPTMAYRLVEVAQQNFLEARHAAEVSAIAESIAILEQNAAEARSSLQSLLNVPEGSHVPLSIESAPLVAAPTKSDETHTRKERFRILADSNRRTIDDLEEFRRKRLAELQVKLAEQRAVYAPAHPIIAATEQSILSLSQESAQVAQLRREEQDLRTQYAEASEASAGVAPTSPQVRLRAESQSRIIAIPPDRRADKDSQRSYAEQRLRIAISKYEELVDRLNEARIELEATRAAFKFRYSVIEPPSVPKRRIRPKVPVFVVGSLVGALMLAVSFAVASELRRGRILESWQVERGLGLQVLGEVTLS
jgi:hypothetical protein